MQNAKDTFYITLRSRLENEMLVVEVEDDGVGMSPERVPESGITRRGAGAGNGIGMRNVRERVQMLYGSDSAEAGARVEVNSRPGRGTRIALWLPVLADAPWPQPMQQNQAKENL